MEVYDALISLEPNIAFGIDDNNPEYYNHVLKFCSHSIICLPFH